jgi:hypothetical protein
VKRMFCFAALCTALLLVTSFAMGQSVPLTLPHLSTGEAHNSGVHAPGTPKYCSPCLFYGGDWNDTSSDWVIFANGNSAGWSGGSSVDDVNIYSAFTVPKGDTWTVTGLFANVGFINVTKMTPSSPQWSINSGMKSGSGGKVIAHGDKTAGTAKKTGRTADSGAGEVTEYTVQLKLAKSVSLKAGTYFESVTPQCTSTSTCASAYFYETDTFNSAGTKQGSNAFGPAEPKGENFQNGSAFGLTYEQLNGAYCSSLGYQTYACNWMSDGVVGTSKK